VALRTLREQLAHFAGDVRSTNCSAESTFGFLEARDRSRLQQRREELNPFCCLYVLMTFIRLGEAAAKWLGGGAVVQATTTHTYHTTRRNRRTTISKKAAGHRGNESRGNRASVSTHAIEVIVVQHMHIHTASHEERLRPCMQTTYARAPNERRGICTCDC
jgi:hypothetical protein